MKSIQRKRGRADDVASDGGTVGGGGGQQISVSRGGGAARGATTQGVAGSGKAGAPEVAVQPEASRGGGAQEATRAGGSSEDAPGHGRQVGGRDAGGQRTRQEATRSPVDQATDLKSLTPNTLFCLLVSQPTNNVFL